MAETQILRFFLQTCLGLHALHKKRILHRDLKTENIFLNKQNEVRIGDFGLARQGPSTQEPVDDPKTQARTQNALEVENTSKVGTPFYLAPELVYEETRQPYSAKSDVWALGVILYELCALRKPFTGQNESELYKSITNDQVANILSVSSEMMTLIKKMLRKDPAKRPTTQQILDLDFVRSKALLL